jgi:hypothetical protein
MSTYWRIFCQTENDWSYGWSDTPLTVCQNDSGHTVSSDSTQELYLEKNLMTTSLNQDFNSSDYIKMFQFTYKSKVAGLYRLKAVIYSVGNVDSFNVRVINMTTKKIIIETGDITNTDQNILYVLDTATIDNDASLVEDSVMSLSIRCNGVADDEARVHVENVVFTGYDLYILDYLL